MTLCPDMLRLITAAVVSLFLLSGSQGVSHEYRQECVVWDNVTHMLEREPRMELVCHKNAQCTGFDCAGNYTYQGLMTLFQRFVIETCFGITIHPCNKPVDMEVYVEWPGKAANFRHTLVGDKLIEVKGAKFDTVAHGHAVAFIDVHMRHITLNGQPYLRIGLRLKIRLTLGVTGIETWPEALAVQLMRDTEVPVPPCDKSVMTPPHVFGHCKVVARGAIQGETREITEKESDNDDEPDTTEMYVTEPVDTTANVANTDSDSEEQATEEPYSGVTAALGLGKSCVTNQMHSCATGEMCVAHNGTAHGHCVCFTGYLRQNHSAACVPAAPSVIPVFIRGHDTHGQKKGASKELIIVLCSCVAGIAVLSIVVLLVILRLRKQRARYAQHERLLNNDDDDDVEPLDVTT